MIYAVIWKEYRQQRMVLAALTVLGALFLLVPALALVIAPAHGRDLTEVWASVRGGPVVLVYIQALVCGGLLLALEGELGTLAFLDALPGSRGRLWRAKLLAGLLLTAAMIVVLMTLSAAVGLFESWRDAGITLAAMACAGVYGFSWGILFSSFGRDATNMILLSLAGQLLWGFFVGAAAALSGAIVSAATGAAPAEPPVAFMLGLIAFAVPAAVAGSAYVFTRLDRSRLRVRRPTEPAAPRRRGVAWRTLIWLAWRQARGFTAGMAVFALLLGLMMFAWGLLVWPLATLLVGVLCGATTFADEQEGPYRFLGDQRFPLGRVWLVKVGVRFAVAAVAALIVLAPSFFVALAHSPVFSLNDSPQNYHFFARVFNSNVIGELCPAGVFLTTWLVAGFAAGCLCGLLFRNGLPAGVLALFMGTLLTAVWVPSMLGGGLHLWQALGAPLLLLAATRLILRPWAAGRIASWTTAVRLTPFVLLAVLWIVGGLWYRVIEIANIPNSPALDSFAASLPTPEKNEGGELARRACLRFRDLRQSLQSVAPPMRPAEVVLESGWKAEDGNMVPWLDKMFAGDWVGTLKKSAGLAAGAFDDLRQRTEFSPTPGQDQARQVAIALAVRGMQRQAAGDDDAYVENLRLGLHLSETMRRSGNDALTVMVGRSVEGILVKGLDRWLEKLNGRPDLLRKALALLARHLEATADDDADRDLVGDLIVRNTADDPFLLLLYALGSNGGEQGGSRVREEAKWAAVAWLIPWERERQARILRVMFWGDARRKQLLERSGQFGPLPQLGPYRAEVLLKPDHLCAPRAMLLKLALRWYQADDGRPADKLDQLVPKYLLSIPTDPFSPDGQPFHYRLSKGEEIEWPEDPPPPGAGAPGAAPAAPAVGAAPAGAPAAPPGGAPNPMPPQGQAPPPGMNAPGMAPVAAPPPHTRKIPAGQGVLWSVGPDGRDDGGRRQTGSLNGEAMWGEDIIFLVPLPPNEEGDRR